MDDIPDFLKYLASLKMQDKYMIHETASNYLLPEDLIEDACSFVIDRDYFAEVKSKSLNELKEAIKTYLTCNEEVSDNKKFVYEYRPWIEVRNKAKALVDELEFDLEAWEQNIINEAEA